MTKEQFVDQFIAPWISPGFLREAIGEIAYNGIIKDVMEKMTELEQGANEP